MAGNRPRGRQKNVTGQGKSVKRRGEGLGTGPVGGSARKPAASTGASGGKTTRSTTRSSGGLSKLIIIILVVLFGGGGSLGALIGGGGGQTSYPQNSYPQQNTQQTVNVSQLYEMLSGGNVSSGWTEEDNTATLDETVVPAARDKFTGIIGNGKDKVTVMVYMCGTDLESRSSMGTSDLQEMLDAKLGKNVNLIVYTGGCSRWRNSVISNQYNQIWQIHDEGLECLEEKIKAKSMTDPDTLSGFIKWCAAKFPANRNMLVFWDHGGGSVSGYGYDEKFASSGAMTLAEIDQALTDGGVKFDFVGYDACLMATTENALMLAKHADYMIASEETEPGIGWYYTNWLSELSSYTSLSTLEIGKTIIDDFVETCAAKCRGQSTTLSIVDLAEAQATIPDALAAFSTKTYDLIKNDSYAQVSKARSGAREFGTTSKIDQIDLVHFAKNMKTKEGDALAQALLGAVKYNRTSSNMTNSYGLSIYFPYRKATMVNSAVNTYEQIGLDSEYARCIKAFASMEVGGQAVSGGTTNPLASLMGSAFSSSQGSYGGSNSAYGNADVMAQLLGSFLSGKLGSVYGIDAGNMDFFGDRAMSTDEMAEYFAQNSLDASQLLWQETEDGLAISMDQAQWNLVQTLHANMFYDDGDGYIDLGTDNVFEFDSCGNLLAPDEITWIAVNDQPVAYYHESTLDDGESYSITGRIPVLYNGERAELVVEFTDADPYGSVVGVRRVYTEGETATVAKTMDTVTDGDVIDFVCDYYSYDGDYLDSYMLGEQLVVDGELVISDVYVDSDAANFTYLFTDIYNQQYWSEPVA